MNKKGFFIKVEVLISKLGTMNIFNIKFQGCNIWFSLSKGQNYVLSTTTNSFMQSFSSDTQP